MRGDKCHPGRGKRGKIPLLPNNVGKKSVLTTRDQNRVTTRPHDFSSVHLGGDIIHLNGLLCQCHFLTLAWRLKLNFFAKSPLKTLQESNWFFCLSFHARSVYLESRYEHLNESAKMIFFQSTEKTKKITNRGYNRCLVLLLNAGWHPNTG